MEGLDGCMSNVWCERQPGNLGTVPRAKIKIHTRNNVGQFVISSQVELDYQPGLAMARTSELESTQ